MSVAMDALTWPLERAPEVLAMVVERSFPGQSANATRSAEARCGQSLLDLEMLDVVFGRQARTLGVQTEQIFVDYPVLSDILRGAAPAVLAIEGEAGPALIAITGRGRSKVRVLGNDLVEHDVRIDVLRTRLTEELEASAREDTAGFVERMSLGPRARHKLSTHLVERQLARAGLGRGWVIRRGASQGFWLSFIAEGFGRRLAWLVGAYASMHGSRRF